MFKINFLKIMLGILVLFGAQGAESSELNESHAIEKAGFQMECLKIYHQYDWRNMSIAVEYEGEEDIAQIKHFAKEFIKGYSNEKDFWEVMNVNLVRALTREFPKIKTMQSKFSLAPDTSLFFSRASTVKYEEGDSVLKEAFGFVKPNYLICNQTFASLDMSVNFDFKDNPTAVDYPDYQWIDEAMMEFFATHPLSTSVWKETKPLLEAYLLECFPSLNSISVELRVAK